jgi:hypothetical protein
LGLGGMRQEGSREIYINEKFSDLYCSPIIQVIKSQRIRQARHVAHIGKGRGASRVWMGKPEGKRTTWKTQV